MPNSENASTSMSRYLSEEMFRIETLKLLIAYPDVRITPEVEVWTDPHPIVEFRKIHSQIRWRVSYYGSSTMCDDGPGVWEELYVEVRSFTAMVDAYAQAETEVERMKAGAAVEQ